MRNAIELSPGHTYTYGLCQGETHARGSITFRNNENVFYFIELGMQAFLKISVRSWFKLKTRNFYRKYHFKNDKRIYKKHEVHDFSFQILTKN